jgi:hypothetical protein
MSWRLCWMAGMVERVSIIIVMLWEMTSVPFFAFAMLSGVAMVSISC